MRQRSEQINENYVCLVDPYFSFKKMNFEKIIDKIGPDALYNIKKNVVNNMKNGLSFNYL